MRLQLVSGLYTVLGMPADTMAQVVNAAMPKNGAGTPTGRRRMQRRIFKVAAFTAAISAGAQLTSVTFCKQLHVHTKDCGLYHPAEFCDKNM